jgi:poly-gamma-glutamate capsule biosynthesis protein CapA/YwtB (metallophosphatase superfamily)
VITLHACGDVGVRRADCAGMFAGVSEPLRAADLCCAQLETTVSERGAKAPNARLAMRAPPAMLAAARAAGIGVMSFAGNHCLAYGYDAFDDTLLHARSAGIALCGAGATLDDARRSLVMEVSGRRVAFIAASSILPEGYAAAADKPGCAPLRAHTLYEQIEHDQPGTPPRIHSFAHQPDLDALLHSIRAARATADIVLVSLHWGIHMVRATLADYQIEVAHAAIDAGADAILGHHPHLLKGVELYRGKPVFYSLGNFAIEQPHVWDPAITRTASFRHLVSLNPAWDMERHYMLPEITRATGWARLLFAASGELEVRFRPAWIDDDSVPRALVAGDANFAAVRALLAESSQEAGLHTEFAVSGDELLLRAAT